MKAVTPIVVATVGIILVAAFLVPAVGLLGGGGEGEDTTYVNDGVFSVKYEKHTELNSVHTIVQTKTGITIDGATVAFPASSNQQPVYIANGIASTASDPRIYIDATMDGEPTSEYMELYGSKGDYTVTTTIGPDSGKIRITITISGFDGSGKAVSYGPHSGLFEWIYLPDDAGTYGALNGDYYTPPAAFYTLDGKFDGIYRGIPGIYFIEGGVAEGLEFVEATEEVDGAVKTTVKGRPAVDGGIVMYKFIMAPREVVIGGDTDGLAWAGPVLVTLMMVAILMIFVKTIGRTD